MKKTFRIEYENERGRIALGSGTHMPILAAEGLGAPEREYRVSEYGDGSVHTCGSRVLPRTITIKFDISRPDLQEISKNIIRMFDTGGTLYCHFGSTHRKITVNRVSLAEFEDMGCFRTFIVQLICDDPFFTDIAASEAVCAEVRAGIKYQNGAWNLGESVVWGESGEAITVQNTGDARTEPSFTITAAGDGTYGAGFELQRLDRAGEVVQSLAFDYLPPSGDVIRICLKSGQRCAESEINGSITQYRTPQTSLSRFWLDTGTNRLKIISHNHGSRLLAVCTWENKYIEGVY